MLQIDSIKNTNFRAQGAECGRHGSRVVFFNQRYVRGAGNRSRTGKSSHHHETIKNVLRADAPHYLALDLHPVIALRTVLFWDSSSLVSVQLAVSPSTKGVLAKVISSGIVKVIVIITSFLSASTTSSGLKTRSRESLNSYDPLFAVKLAPGTTFPEVKLSHSNALIFFIKLMELPSDCSAIP
jgi:uncharacterized membrane protein